MPSNDRDVFDYLTSDKDTSLHLDFLTYAVFAHEKREWIKLWESQHDGHAPSQADIDHWISNITVSQFIGMRSNAQEFFLEAADAYLEQTLIAERESILRSAIMSEVKAASDWRKQLGLALLTAIVAPLLLGGILGAIYFYSNYVTPAEVLKRFGLPAATQPAPQIPSITPALP